LTGGGTSLVVPAAEVYANESEFRGRWLGESDDTLGFLEIQALGGGRFYGRFSADDQLSKYVANMTQETVALDGVETLANVLRFTWQDGRGGIGAGWLMVDEDSSALTGELAYGDSSRSGRLAFVRDGDVEAERSGAAPTPATPDPAVGVDVETDLPAG